MTRPGEMRVRHGLFALAAAVALVLIFAEPKHQDCVDQGTDARFASLPVCWAQQHASWKSKQLPHFRLFGSPEGTNVGVAWPPYLVVNFSTGHHTWRMFRVGFRYDRNWQGYIFPTIALKQVDAPLEY